MVNCIQPSLSCSCSRSSTFDFFQFRFAGAARFDFDIQLERGPVAMTPPTSLGSDCSYMLRNIVSTDGGIAYRVASHTQGTCRETCAAVPLCTGPVYLSEFSSRIPQPGGHLTTCSSSIEHVTVRCGFTLTPSSGIQQHCLFEYAQFQGLITCIIHVSYILLNIVIRFGRRVWIFWHVHGLSTQQFVVLGFAGMSRLIGSWRPWAYPAWTI